MERPESSLTESAMRARPPSRFDRLLLVVPPCAVVAYAFFCLGQYLASGAPTWAYALAFVWAASAARVVQRIRAHTDNHWDVAVSAALFAAAVVWIAFYHLRPAAS